jgi:hypothetical protein
MLFNKPLFGVGVSVVFAVGTTYTTIPENIREAIVYGCWTSGVLFSLQWLYLHWLEKQKERIKKRDWGKIKMSFVHYRSTSGASLLSKSKLIECKKCGEVFEAQDWRFSLLGVGEVKPITCPECGKIQAYEG